MIHADALSPSQRRALHAAADEATVLFLRATSPASVVVIADWEARTGRPVYTDEPDTGDPRFALRVCAATDCEEVYAAPRVYCSGRCRARAWYQARHPRKVAS